MAKRNPEEPQLFAKLPPSSIEMEQAVLGAVLLDNKAIDALEDELRPGDFYRNGHAVTYQAMLDMHQMNAPIDILTLIEYLRRHDRIEMCGGMAYIAGLPDLSPASKHAAAYAKIVKNKSVLRGLVGAATEISTRAYEEPDDTAELLDEAQNMIFQIGQGTTTNEVDLTACLGKALEDIEQLTGDTGLLGLPSGIDALDKKTWGFSPTDLIIIAGRPSMGKTALVLSVLLYNVLRGKTCAFFSVEMGGAALAKRIVLNRAGVEVWAQQALSRDQWAALNTASNELIEIKQRLLIDDSAAITPRQLRARARKWKAQRGLDMIAIDYLQIVSNSIPTRNREAEVADMSRQFKQLAKELDVPVLLLSQLNRSAEMVDFKEPKLSQLRESGAVEQDADQVLFIWQAEQNTNISVAKHRNGPRGVVPVNFHKPTGRFMQVDLMPEDWANK